MRAVRLLKGMHSIITDGFRERQPDALLSVVVPLFNESLLVEELVDRVVRSCAESKLPFELLIVNDGSRDDTLARLVAKSRAQPELRVIDLQRNFGHMAALSGGLASARGDAVVV